jgi:PAX-interacting protein 1
MLTLCSYILLFLGMLAAWKMPINITQESYDKIKSTPPPQRRAKRPRLDKSATSAGDSDQENMLENVEVTNLDPPSNDKRPMVLFSYVIKQSELAKVSCFLNCMILSSL